jgi:hypothetical protein
MVLGPGGLGSIGQTRKEVRQMPKGKSIEKAATEQLVVGAKKHFSNAASLSFGGATFTPAQLIETLQALVDLHQAVDDARTALNAKIVEEVAKAPPLRSVATAFATFVKATFGNSPDTLADFGLKPRKASVPRTIEQNAAAAAKRKATRAVRHTMGTKQKKQLKGTVTTIVAPAASPASTPVAPAPATGAPASAGGVSAPHGT